MPIIPSPYVKSKNLYALDLASFQVQSREVVFNDSYLGHSFWATMDAVWTKTSKGLTTVTKGVLHHSFADYRDQAGNGPAGAGPLTLEAFMEDFDSRYGGNPAARWDGSILWTPSPTPLNEMVDFAAELEPIRISIPAVPPGMDGWYSLT